ncbi:hypothetical protein HPB49_013369 [Dermacentor silvarum]|uniref:Uncharacterized protein n=1 Tax=Dermacentor silvarum TaxID=543639 RepID=A0ACB8CX89_DERSI|nr:hypothetical protein HPB49_013369 [Dermacentor silvarum]
MPVGARTCVSAPPPPPPPPSGALWVGFGGAVVSFPSPPCRRHKWRGGETKQNGDILLCSTETPGRGAAGLYDDGALLLFLCRRRHPLYGFVPWRTTLLLRARNVLLRNVAELPDSFSRPPVAVDVDEPAVSCDNSQRSCKRVRRSPNEMVSELGNARALLRSYAKYRDRLLDALLVNAAAVAYKMQESPPWQALATVSSSVATPRSTPHGSITSEPTAESLGDVTSEATMISRRKILSRSRDELNVDFTVEDEEDVWYQKEKLFKTREPHAETAGLPQPRSPSAKWVTVEASPPRLPRRRVEEATG